MSADGGGPSNERLRQSAYPGAGRSGVRGRQHRTGRRDDVDKKRLHYFGTAQSTKFGCVCRMSPIRRFIRTATSALPGARTAGKEKVNDRILAARLDEFAYGTGGGRTPFLTSAEL